MSDDSSTMRRKKVRRAWRCLRRQIPKICGRIRFAVLKSFASCGKRRSVSSSWIEAQKNARCRAFSHDPH